MSQASRRQQWIDELEHTSTATHPMLQTCLLTVLDHVEDSRAAGLIDRYRPRSTSTDDLDPRIIALCRTPLHDEQTAAMLDRLLAPPDDLEPAWPFASGADWLSARPDFTTLQSSHYFAAHIPGQGLSGPHLDDLITRLDAGISPDVLAKHLLLPRALHDLMRGPPRAWTGGWPAWTLIEAAITHVHRRCAPQHLFPPVLGGLGGYRHFAMLGTYLALWFGERAAWRLALETTQPQDVFSPQRSACFAMADLQAWQTAGGISLGPAFADPVAWAKLMAMSSTRGPLGAILRRLDPTTPTSWAAATELPNLLEAASQRPWSQAPCWTASRDEDQLADVIRTAVEAIFIEDVPRNALYAGPADPPGGIVTLDVERCLLAGAVRGHQQYTEPARWLLPPSWCGALHRRGLRTVVFEGCRFEHRHDLTQALMQLYSGDGSLSAQQHHTIGPNHPTGRVSSSPADVQVRHDDIVFTLGGALCETLDGRLHRDHFRIARSPFGRTGDPVSSARALAWSCHTESLPTTATVQTDQGWQGRWCDPTWVFTRPAAAIRWLEDELKTARDAMQAQRTILWTWDTALAHEDPQTGEILPAALPGTRPVLLTVQQITTAVRDALDVLRHHTGRVRVVILINPSRVSPDPALASHHLDRATLLLAAQQVAQTPEVVVFPAFELVRDELRDHAWYAKDGQTLTSASERVLLDRLLAGLATPDARQWHEGWQSRDPDDLASTSVRPGPFLPPLTPASTHPQERLREEILPEPVIPAFDWTPWTREFTDTLALGTYVPYGEQEHWSQAVLGLILQLDLAHAEASRLSGVLQGLEDKLEDVDDPELLAAPYVHIVTGWIARDHIDANELAPRLRFALNRHWLPELTFDHLALEERSELAKQLLGRRPRPRKGRPLHSPLDRCVVALIGFAASPTDRP